MKEIKVTYFWTGNEDIAYMNQFYKAIIKINDVQVHEYNGIHSSARKQDRADMIAKYECIRRSIQGYLDALKYVYGAANIIIHAEEHKHA